MIKFIDFPHLPKGRVTDVLIDPRTPEKIISSLENINVKSHKACLYINIAYPIMGHADMQFVPVGRNTAICIPELVSYYKELFPGINIISGKINPSFEYPEDIAYNEFVLDKHLFGKLDFIDETIKLIFCSQGYNFTSIKQGYAKCSVCIVDRYSIITADKGIYNAVKECGYDALLIKSGYINLHGYEYGFIGGCSGKLSEDILCFTGNIKMHPDYNLINEFILSKGVSIINLTDDTLIDIGGIIPILES